MANPLSPVMVDSSPDSSDEETRLLFCPFCRECYEGERECPVHELELVAFTDLPKQAHESVQGWEEPVAPWDPRFGRGFLAAGVVLALVGFLLPFASGTIETGTVEWTGLDIANSRAPNLWSVPFAAVLFVVFLYRRLTPLKMRGARLAALMLAVVPGVSLYYTVRNVLRGVEGAAGALTLEFGPGLYVMGVSVLVLLIGAVRFGAMPAGQGLPHGAGPDDHPGRGIDHGPDER